MNLTNIIIQGIGYVGLAFAVIAFQCKSHKKVMICRTLNEAFFAIQYICLGAYTGAVMNVLSSTRNISFAVLVEKGKSTKRLQIVFSIVFLVSGLLTPGGLIRIAVIAAKIISTIAYGIKNTKYIRFLTLPTSIFWLIYNILCHSSAGIICEIFTIISLIAAIIRIDIIEKTKSNKSKHSARTAT